MEATRAQELIQADLDGKLSTAESAELARLLLQDPEARRLHDELRRTHALLRGVSPAQPPAGLRPAILASIGLSSRSTTPGSGGGGRWPALRLAAAIVGGLVAAGIGYTLLDAGQPGTDLQGSLGAAIPATAGGQAAARAEQASFQAEGIEARATLHRSGAGMRLDLELGGTTPYEVVATFDPGSGAYVGPDGGATITQGNGTVVVQAQPGGPVRTLEFSGHTPIRVQVRSRDRVLASQELSVGAAH